MTDPPVLFLWNQGKFADDLRLTGYAVAHSPRELQRLRRKSRLRRAPIVVLAETKNFTNQLTEFAGLDFVVELFNDSLPVPQLVVCSFLSRQQLSLVGGIAGDVANGPFSFCHLPATPDELVVMATETHAPSEMVKAWLRDYVFTPHPFPMWLHNFQRESATGIVGFRRAISTLLQQFLGRKRYLIELFPSAADVEQALMAGSAALDNGDLSAIDYHRDRIGIALNKAANDVFREIPLREAEPGCIVVVEDDDDQRKNIENGLRPYFNNIEAFASAIEALQFLEKNNVDAVISDWDLRMPDGGMQLMQGPDLLLEAASKCVGPLIALTSLPSNVVSTILNAAPIHLRGRLSWFPKTLGSLPYHQDYGALAHQIVIGLRESQAWLSETPASRFTPWREHGLGTHYVAVRRWDISQQQKFFEECSAKAQQIIEAFRDNLEVRDVTDPPFSLSISSPSGDSSRISSTKFRDVLSGRLVILALYSFQKPRERSFVRVFQQLRPTVLDGKSPEQVLGSVKPTMALLGIPITDRVRIALHKLILMPHEIAWLEVNKIQLIDSALTQEEREAATELTQQSKLVIRWLEKALGIPPQTLECPDPEESLGSLPVELIRCEDALCVIEEAGRVCRGLDRTERTAAAIERFKLNLREILDEENSLLFSGITNKLPDWHDRIGRVLHNLS